MNELTTIVVVVVLLCLGTWYLAKLSVETEPMDLAGLACSVLALGYIWGMK